MTDKKQSMRNSSDELSTSGHGTPLCQPCLTREDSQVAVGYCQDCKDYLCDTCYTYHTRPTPTRHHHLLGASEMPLQVSSSTSEDFCVVKCDQHPKYLLEFFCTVHDQLACSSCAGENHKTCDELKYIPDIAKGIADSTEMSDLNLTLLEIDKSFNNIKEKVNANTATAKFLRTETKRRVRRQAEQLIDSVTKQKKEMEEYIDAITEKDSATMDMIHQESDNELLSLQQLQKDLQKKVRLQQHCQLFVAMKTAKVNLKKTLRERKNLEEKNEITRLIFTPEEEVQKSLVNVGIGNVSEASTSMMAKHMKDLDILGPQDLNKWVITGGILTEDDYLVVCHNPSQAVKVFSISRNVCLSDIRLSSRPWCITSVETLSEGQQLLVTLPDEQKLHYVYTEREQLFDNDPKYDIAVNGRCRGITTNKEVLIVSFDDPNKVDILSMLGDLLRTFDSDDKGKPIFNCPFFLALNLANNLLYVSNYLSGNVFCLKLDGTVLAKYVDHSTLKDCSGLTLDLAGNVFICGYNSQNIIQLSPFLNSQNVLLSKENGVKSPEFILHCPDQNRLVYVQLNGNIRVYQLHTDTHL